MNLYKTGLMSQLQNSNLGPNPRFCRWIPFLRKSPTLSRACQFAEKRNQRQIHRIWPPKRVLQLALILFLLAGCTYSASTTPDQMSSIQILDRNGFSETISLQDRLATYDKTDFMQAQPYQKVVRVYKKAGVGKTISKMTTYHSNGELWQYLEVCNGRAYGDYKEWHPNGQLKISAFVIEGTPDLSEMAQRTWLFDGLSEVFDEQGRKVASIPYSKGVLEGESFHYFPTGQVMKRIPYQKNEIHGTFHEYSQTGECLESTPYLHGEKEGLSTTFWSLEKLKSEELYQNGLLVQAQYFNVNGEVVAEIQNSFGKQAVFQDGFLASLIEYQNGTIEGLIQNFNSAGTLIGEYHLKDGMKTGEEWEYYPIATKPARPKLYLEWDQDTIQGTAKTWYETGVLESQREIHNNKKHGLSFGWFKEGDLMLMEEYEDDLLIKGSYFKKWEKKPISKVENGKGTATLFDKDGRFIRKILYEKGVPQNDP